MDSRYASIIGTSAKIRTVLEAAQRAAKSDAGVLLLGESGTGKELLARSIHQWSPRHAMPLVVINCVALTETLLENELFGHERGAFTGADRLQKGKLEMAEGGTVFFDEIGDMSLPLQAKLLRVLQDREFHRVGGTRLVSVNIRIIAATNKESEAGRQGRRVPRRSLFPSQCDRLDASPLRERLEDFPASGQVLLEPPCKRSQTSRHVVQSGRPGRPGALFLAGQHPGVGQCDRPRRHSEPDGYRSNPTCWRSTSPRPTSNSDDLSYLRLPYHESMEAHSRHIIEQALRDADGNQTKAAERLRLQRTYLARLLRQQRQKLRTKPTRADERVTAQTAQL